MLNHRGCSSVITLNRVGRYCSTHIVVHVIRSSTRPPKAAKGLLIFEMPENDSPVNAFLTAADTAPLLHPVAIISVGARDGIIIIQFNNNHPRVHHRPSSPRYSTHRSLAALYRVGMFIYISRRGALSCRVCL